jgi:hypothetical protein
MFLQWRPKSWKKREKCASKILVYGFILARVNQETKPWIASAERRNRKDGGARPKFLKKYQEDSSKGAPLNPASRGFRLYYT